MSTTPTPPDPVPTAGPAPAGSPATETAPAPTGPTEPAAAARSAVPRWLLVAIVVVVLVAGGAFAVLALTGGSDDEPPLEVSELPAADVTTIVGGPVTLTSHTQWDLDTNGFIYRGGRCVFANPAAAFEGGAAQQILCLLIFIPDTVVLEGRDIIVTPGGPSTPAALTIAEGAEVLDEPVGCPDADTEIELPPPGTPPGPPIACVRSTDGAAFAIYVTAVTVGGPTIAVAMLP